jgi:drug/metabolite transporter (DMT)-like permease
MSSRTKALLAIILVSFLWSTAGLAKIVILELGPFFAAFLRALIAFIVILPFFIREKSYKHHLFRDLLPLSLLSTANILFYYLGLAFSTANAGAVINAGIPMITAVIAHFLIGERITVKKITGITIGLIGVFFITLLPVVSRGESVSGTVLGNIFFVIQIFIWSLYTIGSRHIITTKKYSLITISCVSFLTTSIIFGFISLFTFEPRYLTAALNPRTIILLLYLGVMVTVVTYLLYQWAIKHSSATTASLNSYIGPVFAVLVNYMFLGETITSAFLFGSIFVFIGIFIVSGSGIFREAKSWINR